MKSNKRLKKSFGCCTCSQNAKNKSIYGNYEAGEDVNSNSRLVKMIDDTVPIECDK